jgi:hypothetical protein
MARKGSFCSTAVLVPLSAAEQAADAHLAESSTLFFGTRLCSYCVTDTDWSAGGGKRRVTSVVFWERMEMRFAQSENIPFE